MSTSKELFISQLMNSNLQLRMYGSPEELSENLSLYRKFSGSDSFFELDVTEPFHSKPRLFQNERGQNFICKTDIYAYLQLHINESPDETFINDAVSIYIKKMLEKNLSGCCEYIAFNFNEYCHLRKDIMTMLEERIKQHRTSETTRFLIFNQYNIHEVGPQYNSLFRGFEGTSEPLTRALGRADKVTPMRSNQSYYQRMYVALQDVFFVLEKFMRNRSTWFSPYTAKAKATNPMLRVFDDGSQRFLMLSEIYKVRNDVSSNNTSRKLSVFRSKYEKPPQDAFSGMYSLTISFDDFKKSIGNEIKMIEMIFITFKKPKHRASPLVKEDGTYCLLAADVLFETLRELICGVRVFQKSVYCEDLDTNVNKYFEETKSFFNSTLPMYLLDYDSIERIYTSQYNLFNNISLSPSKDGRNAKVNGFTAQNLRNELNYLSLSDYFPDITSHAERVYEGVLKAKKGKFLRTCDLFDAVEQCQLICILLKFPYLAKFLHNQNACGRVFYRCKFCQEVVQETKENIQLIPKKLKKSRKEHPVKQASTETEVTRTKDKCTLTDPLYCEECSQDMKVIRETKETIISEQNKAAMLEKKVAKNEKKIEDGLEKERIMLLVRNNIDDQLEEKNERIRNLEEQSANHRDAMKEVANLKKQLAELDKKTIEMKNSIGEHKKRFENAALLSKNLAKQLRTTSNSEQGKIDMLRSRLSQLNLRTEANDELSRLENEMEIETRETERLRKDVEQLRLSNEDKDRSIQELYAIHPSLSHRVPQDTASSENVDTILETPFTDSTSGNLLNEQLKLRDEIMATNTIKHAIETANKMVELADTDEMKVNAKQELKMFYKNYKVYMDVLNSNIELLRNNVLESEVPKLPMFPTFSDEFVTTLKLAMKKNSSKEDSNEPGCSNSQVSSSLMQPEMFSIQNGAPIQERPIVPESDRQRIVPAQIELDDLRCLICRDLMVKMEETSKCSYCYRRYHSVCVDKWLAIERKCPACKRLFLKENEYPRL